MAVAQPSHTRRRGTVAAANLAASDAFSSCISFTPSADGTNTPLSQPEQCGGDSEGPHLSAGMYLSLAKLERDSHAVRLKTARLEDGDKNTGPVYARAVASYEKWWAGYQLQLFAEDPSYTGIPAFPVTAAKAAMFLDYETMRPKLRNGSTTKLMPNSNVGKQVISQKISALENWRLNHQHEYKDDSEAQTSLRLDNRIRRIESASKHNEPKRIASAQALKAAGTSSDTYTDAELRRISLNCLENSKGKKRAVLGLRDRAMLLFSTATAVRGEGARMLLWSDLFIGSIRMDEVQRGLIVPVLGCLADNAKHNQTGRVDEIGTIRHSNVEVCAVGALAMLFFAHFHIQHASPPTFAPDFDCPKYGEYGHRPWYDFRVFCGEDPNKDMSYDNHHQRMKLIHLNNDISITKVTHASRHYAAQNARSHGASVSDTKALGGWNESGAFRNCYDRAFPIGALLGAAGFNANCRDQYSLPRGTITPPQELLVTLFPWVEAEATALLIRAQEHRCKDIALRNFLDLLTWFRAVLLQDAAVLYPQQPDASIFQYQPFNTQRFREFSAQATIAVAHAASAAQDAYRKMPEHLVAALRGTYSDMRLEQQLEQQHNKHKFETFEGQLIKLEGVLNEILVSARGGKKAKLPSPVQPPASNFESYAAPGPRPPFTTPTMFATGPSSLTINFSGPTSLPSPAAESTPSPPVLAPSFEALPANIIECTDPLAAAQRAEWSRIIAKYGISFANAHQWDWEDGSFLPQYDYQPVNCITDIWQEWTAGLNGYMPVRDLTEAWSAKWRRNIPSKKNEHRRRMAVINLVTELLKQPRWDISLALRFLKEQYEGIYRPRAFCDYLMKSSRVGFQAVLATAQSYP